MFASLHFCSACTPICIRALLCSRLLLSAGVGPALVRECTGVSGANHVGQTCVAAPLSIISYALLSSCACSVSCVASRGPGCEPPSPGVWRPTYSACEAVLWLRLSSTVATVRSTAETKCKVGVASDAGGNASCDGIAGCLVVGRCSTSSLVVLL